MSLSSPKGILVAASVVLACACAFGFAGDAWGQQYVAAGCAGDPGDGSEVAPSGGGNGDPTDGEGGAPTDGKGWIVPDGQTAHAKHQDGEAGDPGDGEEFVRCTALANLSPEHWWAAVVLLVQSTTCLR